MDDNTRRRAGAGEIELLLRHYPRLLLKNLLGCAAKLEHEIYLVGGAVRDLLQGVACEDLDLAITADSFNFLWLVRERLGAGTLIPLGDVDDDTCRLVIDGRSVDVSGFRKGAVTIADDLVYRDFTINAMALGLADLLALPAGRSIEELVIDPLGGREDFSAGTIRACPDSFVDDPLRLLRAYRLAAQFGFTIEPATLEQIESSAGLIGTVAAERISSELDLIMQTRRSFATVSAMGDSGLLGHLVPELFAGAGVSQPPFHHLDVMTHNIKTVDWIERIAEEPERFFAPRPEPVAAVFEDLSNLVEVKWAALLHDIGKPETREVGRKNDGDITFYAHDEAGAELVETIGARLRWSNQRTKRVGRLVAMHMHPFHLNTVREKEQKLSRRAKYKLCKRAGDDLTALFIIAMADSLAGQGPEKPAGIEDQLADLFADLFRFAEQTMAPVLSGPKLLSGHDLIEIFGLEAGPEIGRILDMVEAAAVEGQIGTRHEALALVRRYLLNRETGAPGAGSEPDSPC